MTRLRPFVQLIKPGITLSNMLSGIAGFLLATSYGNWGLSTVWIGLAFTAGIAGVIASACVVNNLIDRQIDRRMKRTKQRGLITGEVSPKAAIVLAITLGLAGFGFLLAGTNTMTVILGVVAYLWYIVIYGVSKRKTAYSTVIGAVCGALPPMAGYAALTGVVDVVAWVLFLLLFVWQLPHFYAIAMFRQEEYRAAHLPIWSVTYGSKSTKWQVIWHVGVFMGCVPLLPLLGATGVTSMLVLFLLSLRWFIIGVGPLWKVSDEAWARRMFGESLIVLLGTLVLISAGGYLP